MGAARHCALLPQLPQSVLRGTAALGSWGSSKGREKAALPARSPPPAACSHFVPLTGFLTLNLLMSKRGKRRGPRAPKLGQRRGRAAPPSIAYGGERCPPPTLVPHCVSPALGAPRTAPLTPSTSPLPQQPHAGAPREGCPMPLPPQGGSTSATSLGTGFPHSAVPIVTQAGSRDCTPGG